MMRIRMNELRAPNGQAQGFHRNCPMILRQTLQGDKQRRIAPEFSGYGRASEAMRIRIKQTRRREQQPSIVRARDPDALPGKSRYCRPPHSWCFQQDHGL
jgi:hypothetical protein